jgi:hypothetical protein
MKDKQDLIYDLIFSESTDYEINVAEYILDIYRYDYFISDIKKILKKSKVILLSDKVDIDPKKVIWRLKVKK